MQRDALLLAGLAALFFVLVTRRGQEFVSDVAMSVESWADKARDLLRELEGFSATPYADAKGTSIGYGHQLQPGETFSYVTIDQAEALLASDMQSAAAAVANLVAVPLTENQRAALVSFAYNVGAGAFAGSTLLKKLNAGDYAGAAGEFGRWVYSTTPAGEKVRLPALEARRETERNTFLA